MFPSTKGPHGRSGRFREDPDQRPFCPLRAGVERPTAQGVIDDGGMERGGKAEQSKVFVQEPALASPLGVGVFGGKVYVSQPQEVLVYTDVNGNGVFDPASEVQGGPSGRSSSPPPGPR